MLNLALLKKKKDLLQPPPMASPQMSANAEPDEGENDSTDESDNEEDPTDPDDEDQSVPNIPQVQPQPNNGQSRFQQILGQATNAPKGPLSQKFSDYLNTPAPDEKDYKPGGMNRLAAILGGASEGYQRGANAGVKTAQNILDDPYKKAMNKYALEGGRLEKGAEVESKDLGRAASIAKTSMLGEHNERVDETNKIKALAQDRHWTSQDSNAAQAGATKGWTHHVNTADGHLVFTRPKADGTLEALDGGKADESIPEKTKRILSEKAASEKLIGDRIKSTQDNNALNTQMENNRKAGLEITKKQVEDANKPVKPAKPLLPAQKSQQAQLNMQKVMDKYGDKVKDYFTTDAKGKIKMIVPEDPSDPIYKSIYKNVYGE